jgi:hypothetical protein
MLFRNEPYLLVAHRKAVASKTAMELLDAHSISVDIGPDKHRIVCISMFLWATALPQLRNSRTTLWNRCVERPDRRWRVYVGVRIVGVPRAGSVCDGTIDDEWPHNSTTINGRKAV